MNSPILLSLPSETIADLRKRAESVGAPYSAIADLLIRYGLARITDDALRTWADTRPARKGPLGGGLTKDERTCNSALQRLLSNPEKAWRFPLQQVANESGLPPRTTYRALKALQGRSMVRGTELPEVDRWGRPTESYWWLPASEEEYNRMLPQMMAELEAKLAG
jgi:hypothetical protein